MTSSTDPAALIEGGIEWDKVAQGYSEMASFMASLPRIERTREEVRSLLGTTPADEIYREHSVTLRRYRGQGARRGEPVLMVPSLVNRSWIMDFLPGESMAEYLSRQRFDVFLLDWGMPNPGQRQLKLEYYLDHYLDRVVKRTLKAASARTCHLLGYCLGGTMSALYLASRADAPVTSFISMTTPVNFVDRGILSWWSRPGHFDADKLVNTFGNIPDTFFRMSFPWIVPTAPLKKLRTLIERHNDPAYLKSFLALDIWLADNVPFPGEVYRQVIKDLYQENRLVNGTMRIGDRSAKLSAIGVPVLNIVAKYDHVAPAESCQALSDHVKVPGSKLEVLEAGHLGPALGRDMKFQRTDAYWNVVVDWLERFGPGQR